VSDFAHPEWLAPALLVALSAALALSLARRRAAARLVRLLGRGSVLSGGARDAALLAALVLVLAALVGPRGGSRERMVPASGLDLVVLLDVSRSMDAADTPPSRLARTLRAADELLARLEPADRVALAGFASRGVLFTPLTPDREALRELLAGFDSELISPRGSSLGDGVRAALGAFEAGSERPRVLLVLSDGEDSARGSDLPLSELARADVRVLAAAFGSEEGAMLPDHGAPLVDGSGTVVVSRRTQSPLARLAETSGGELWLADAFGALDLERVLRAVRRDAGSGGALVARRERAVQVLPLAALAFVLLLCEGLPLRAPRLRRAGLALPALLLLAAGPWTHEAALRLQRAGVAALEGGDVESAARMLESSALVTSDRALAALAYYHLGVARLAAGRLEEASGAFFDALALDPNDEQARFDLEWTLAALAKRPPPPPAESDKPREEEPKPQPAPQREAEPEETGRKQRAPGPIALDAEERQRLLERVPDDPRRALRATAQSAPPERSRPRGPAW
jgi:Ca-activated chloride channel family protein